MSDQPHVTTTPPSLAETAASSRNLAERLLLSALREQDVARNAIEFSDRASYLAKASRELAQSLDEDATRSVVRRLTLPRAGAWCIVDVVELNGKIHRLPVLHPDPVKQALARTLEVPWPPSPGGPRVPEPESERHQVVTEESRGALMIAAHGEANLQILREIGFGSLLVVPLIVRARVQGAMTFVSQEGDPEFSQDEILLALDIAARCAMALDNARLYREADALRLAAEAANKSKSEFLGSMSHELRTPLNAIGGFTALLDMEIQGPLSEGQHTALSRIKANQQHLLTLISDILNFVRIESGRMAYRKGEVPLEGVLTDVASMLSGAIAEKQLRLDGPRDHHSAVAWADLDRVKQIIMNLVMNAVKYVPVGGGTITLECEIVGDRALARVADSGPGIPGEQLESIFEPFVQLRAGLTARQGGVGLGLAISRDLARAMGGDLTASSTLGTGSCFTLTLPVREHQQY